MTKRLRLIPCSLPAARAILLERQALQEHLGADVPADWPTEELKGFLPLYIEQLEKQPNALGWGVWLLILRGEGRLVGDAGFHGKRDVRGYAEIGYSVHPNYRNRGIASEAVHALIDWAFREDCTLRKIGAECDKGNHPSIKVLKKVGMTCVGSEGTVLLWERTRSYGKAVL
ncbi:MAG TPA: GNAT family N-acetyltransferase [Bacillales bacterium]|nr:GNAT family N-acetyltransferase [Bacillales bacterium]